MKNDPNSPKLHGFFSGKDKRFEAVRFKGFEPSFMCFLRPSIRGNGVLLGMWECFSGFKTFD